MRLPTSAQSMLSRAALALPDAMSSGAFLLLWIAPFALGPHGVRNALLLMIVEFLLIHAAAMLGASLEDSHRGRGAKARSLLGFGLFYGMFIAAFALIFEAWWPVLALLWLLGSKLLRLFDLLRSEDAHARRVADWGLQAVVYLLGAFATLFLWLPELGLGGLSQTDLDLPGEGLWVEQPHRVLAFGALYFGALAWVKWKH
jgi:hypothetical protein